MWPFKQIKEWFTAGTVFQDTLSKTITYLPVGNLGVLLDYQKRFLPYTPDLANGKYDKLKEYQGAELAIIQRGDDCEGLAGFFSEVIRQWKGWESWHVAFVFYRLPFVKYEAHDVCVFKRPDGLQGWIDGAIYEGDYEAMHAFYKAEGWFFMDWWEANDIGERTKPIDSGYQKVQGL